MERKYYLRGLGVGIAVTAIIMGVALPDSRMMTDDEIVARAKELGLVENTVLSNTTNDDDPLENKDDNQSDEQDAAKQLQNDLTADDPFIDTDPGIEDAAANEAEDVTNGDAEKTAPEADNEGQEEDVDQEDADTDIVNTADEEDTNKAAASSAVKVITVNSGDSSYTVAKKLADVGAVTSAQSFDTFLCQNGYDKRLRTGNFSIPANASDEQIARIVTGLE